jgi:hypothetical protein
MTKLPAKSNDSLPAHRCRRVIKVTELGTRQGGFYGEDTIERERCGKLSNWNTGGVHCRIVVQKYP